MNKKISVLFLGLTFVSSITFAAWRKKFEQPRHHTRPARKRPIKKDPTQLKLEALARAAQQQKQAPRKPTPARPKPKVKDTAGERIEALARAFKAQQEAPPQAKPQPKPKPEPVPAREKPTRNPAGQAFLRRLAETAKRREPPVQRYRKRRPRTVLGVRPKIPVKPPPTPHAVALRQEMQRLEQKRALMQAVERISEEVRRDVEKRLKRWLIRKDEASGQPRWMDLGDNPYGKIRSSAGPLIIFKGERRRR